MEWDTIPRLDFFSNLDLDIVLKIVSFLHWKDVLRCMCVSKGWNEILRLKYLDSFWKEACSSIGLNKAVIAVQKRKFGSCSEVFFAAKAFGDVIASHAPRMKVLNSFFPFDSTTHCEHAGRGYFVKHVSLQCVDSVQFVIGHMSAESDAIVALGAMNTQLGGWMSWTGMCGGHVMWCLSSGHWYGFGVKQRNFYLFMTDRNLRYNNETAGGCPKCRTLALASVESKFRGYSWKLEMLRFEGKDATKPVKWIKGFDYPEGLSQFMPKPVTVIVSPENGCCESHLVFLQSGYGTAAYRLTYDSASQTFDLSNCLKVMDPYSESGIAVMMVNNTTRIRLTADHRYLGIVTSLAYPKRTALYLTMWNIYRNFRKVSSVLIDWKENYSEPTLVSLGGVYSAISSGYLYGIFKIFESQTGKIVLDQTGVSRAIQATQPFVFDVTYDYFGAINEECLSEIVSPLPFRVIFRDHRARERTNMKLLYLDPPLATGDDRRMECDEMSS